jgi:NADH-quinone oxidoreductase subunit D
MQSYLGKRGDSYDRFLIRVREMYESVNIIFQVLNNLNNQNSNTGNLTKKGFNTNSFYDFLFQKESNFYGRNSKYSSMESLINHFKLYSEGLRVPKGFIYKSIEASKGEFGVSLISDGSPLPYRCKIRTPAYHHIQVMPRLLQGHFFADLVTVLGSQDIVFGDVDR